MPLHFFKAILDFNLRGYFLFQGRYSHLRGTHLKTSTSLFYVNDVVLPILTSMFDHLAANEYGSDLLCKLNFFYMQDPKISRTKNVSIYLIYIILFQWMKLWLHHTKFWAVCTPLELMPILHMTANIWRLRLKGIDRQSEPAWEHSHQPSQWRSWSPTWTSIINSLFWTA